MNLVDAAAPAAPGSTVSAAPAVRFLGDRRAYWRLLIRGAALLAVTLGIYRFWFSTDIRRYLWSNTEVGGVTLEYTGTAMELLIGFLIAIALLVPLYVVLFVVALNLGPVGQLMGVIAFPLLAFLGHFAVYRARRYRLTRTVYRGVRCHQGGSAWRYAVCALFWWTLIVVTLGLAYPFAQARLERFKLRHTYYGDLAGRFEGSGLHLFLRGLPMWLLVIGPLAFALVFAIAAIEWDKLVTAAAGATSGEEFIKQLEVAHPNVYAAVVVAIAAVSASAIMAIVLFPVFQAMMLRWWLAGLRLGEVTFRSHLRTGQIYGAYLRFLWYGLLFLLAASILGAIVFVGLGVGLAAVGQREIVEIFGTVAGVGFYVVLMLGFSTIYQATVKLSLWRCGVESVELEGLSALDRVKAEGAPSSALGEGLADALNVGGF
jgi:uncharacterized membrane protein YjgN (DUF898 family)